MGETNEFIKWDKESAFVAPFPLMEIRPAIDKLILWDYNNSVRQ